MKFIKENYSMLLCLGVGLVFIILSFNLKELEGYFFIFMGSIMVVSSIIGITNEAIKLIRNETKK